MFDEVKTGFTLAWGGAVEAFGVCRTSSVWRALGAGLPCGAIGGTDEAMGMVMRGELDQQGHVQRQSAHDGRGEGDLLEVMTPEAYGRFDELNAMPRAASRRARGTACRPT